MKTIRLFLVSFFAMAFSALAADAPYTVQNLSIRQRWPWSKLVDINFTLVPTNASVADVTAELTPAFQNCGAALAVSPEALSGDLWVTNSGAKHIVWDPTIDHAGETLTGVTVSIAGRHKPTYMVVNLQKAAGTEGQITYYYDDSSWPQGSDAFASNCLYNLTFRRIPATTSGEWMALSGGTNYYWEGSATNIPGHNTSGREDLARVKLTNDYWVCISSLTAGQLYWASQGTLFSNSQARLVCVSYNQMRGSVADGINWPSTLHAVSPSSYLQIFRDRTGLAIDLLTSAEYEYATRAGTTTMFYDGGNSVNSSMKIGRYSGNGNGRYDTVPQYAPNNWGLYDMVGNMYQFCLDWAFPVRNAAIIVINPTGDVQTSGNRVLRSCGVGGGWTDLRSASLNHIAPTALNRDDIGFRLGCPYTGNK